MEAREAIQGDVQLARRFDVLTMPRWSADETFEELVRAILRNQPMRERSVLTAKALRHIFLTTDGIKARIFRMMNALAIAAIESGLERITDEAVLAWRKLPRPWDLFAFYLTPPIGEFSAPPRTGRTSREAPRAAIT
jgi:hypothetical protein